ncbi:premnaspirodiene oxygenase-like [Cornus florida]|uniref:premnaspirodiene oxygenase-like n=1 Tax=Cornus florida TaxID=4283 RepID=UPI0028A1F5C1|nr:premnaspirodiene oxygenase-like [Cornus florida]
MMLQLFLTFLLCLLLIVKHWKMKTSKYSKKLPPGPWKLPIIGNLHQLVGSLPQHALKALAKKHGPLMHLQLGEVSAVVISSPELAQEVLKQRQLSYAQRPQILAVEVMSYDGSSIFFAPYNDYWRQVRKICVTELLSAKRVDSFKSVRQEEVQNLIQCISSSRGLPINMSHEIFSLSNSIISRAAFGKACADQGLFIETLDEIISLGGGFGLHDLFPSLKILHYISGTKPVMKRLQRKMDKILNTIMNEHRAKRKHINDVLVVEEEEDLVDVLLNMEEGSTGADNFSLTTDNIKGVILDIFGAGSETSASTMVWAMSEMVKNPRIMKKAQAEVREALKGRSNNIDEKVIHELNYLKCIVKETLRLHPPGPLLPRESIERDEINGYEIPAKTKILINVWEMSTDPKYWGDGDCFRPERFVDSSMSFKGTNFEYLPFGAGRRICPGISFAIAGIELSLAQLLYHFDWKVPNGSKPEELNMTETFGISAKRKYDLELIAINPMSSIA